MVRHSEDIHTTAARRLAAIGQRYTASRRAIVEILARADGPRTLPAILRDDDDDATRLARTATCRS